MEIKILKNIMKANDNIAAGLRENFKKNNHFC